MSTEQDSHCHRDELLQRPSDDCTLSVRVSRKAGFKDRLTVWFHSKAFQLFVVVFSCLDGLIVICFLLLEIEVLKLKPGPLRSHLVTAQFVLECSSMAIVSIFVVEIPLRLWSLGYNFFCKHWLELIDAFVCIVSFAVDLYNVARYADHSKGQTATHMQGHLSYEQVTLGVPKDVVSSKSTLADAAGLIVLFRLWRIIRIVNAIIMSVATSQERTVKNLRDTLKRTQERVQILESFLSANNLELPPTPVSESRK